MDKQENKITMALECLISAIKKGDLVIELHSLSPAEIVARNTAKTFYDEQDAWNEIKNYSFTG